MTETGYFVAQFDTNCLQVFPTHADQLETYKKVLKCYVSEQLVGRVNEASLDGLAHKHIYQRALNALANNTNKIDSKILEAYSGKDSALGQYVRELCNQFSKGAKVSELRSVAESYRAAMESDRLYAATTVEQRSLMPLLAIGIENTACMVQKCLAVGVQSAHQIRRLTNLQSSQPLVQTRWTLLGADVHKLDQDILKLLPAKITSVEAEIDSPTAQPLRDSFDLLYVDKVLCRQGDIGRYLANLKQFVKQSGLIIVNEITSEFDLAFLIDGLTMEEVPVVGDGKRVHGMYQTHDDWMATFKENGLQVASYQTDSSMFSTVYLLKAAYKQPNTPVFIDVDDLEEFEWVEKIQTAIKDAQNEPDKTIWLTSQKVRDNGVCGLSHCLRMEYLSDGKFRCLADISLKKDSPTFDLNDAEVRKWIDMDLHSNCYRDGVWGRICSFVNKEEDQHHFKQTEWAFLTNMVRFSF